MISENRNGWVEVMMQQEHAALSGECMKYWHHTTFKEQASWSSALQATARHDDAWKTLDEEPMLDENGWPVSFVGYPVPPKLGAYRNTINALEEEDPYQAYLISSHYGSFFKESEVPEEIAFMQEEIARQQRLIVGYQWNFLMAAEHFHLLQFFDDLSLYICMNTPGASKEQEVPWFRDGFRQTFASLDHETIHAYWEDEETVALQPFPFTESFTVEMERRCVQQPLEAPEELWNVEPDSRKVTLKPAE